MGRIQGPDALTGEEIPGESAYLTGPMIGKLCRMSFMAMPIRVLPE
jgi:hypothetical protein